MLYAIFADTHSNLEAYQAFIEDSEKEGIREYFCVGDIVGYGADPHQCIELTKQLNCQVVCGNHDWAAAEKLNIEYFNRYAREAALWTQERLDDIDKNYLASLTPVFQDRELTLVHGTLEYPEDFEYVTDVRIAARTIHAQLTPVCFIGHSHVAGVFYDSRSGRINYTTIPEITIQEGKRYLVNVGSIGQPRDGDWRASYCIYDTEKESLRIKRISYDVERAREKILKAGLPKHLADRILIGR